MLAPLLWEAIHFPFVRRQSSLPEIPKSEGLHRKEDQTYSKGIPKDSEGSGGSGRSDSRHHHPRMPLQTHPSGQWLQMRGDLLPTATFMLWIERSVESDERADSEEGVEVEIEEPGGGSLCVGNQATVFGEERGHCELEESERGWDEEEVRQSSAPKGRVHLPTIRIDLVEDSIVQLGSWMNQSIGDEVGAQKHGIQLQDLSEEGWGGSSSFTLSCGTCSRGEES